MTKKRSQRVADLLGSSTEKTSNEEGILKDSIHFISLVTNVFFEAFYSQLLLSNFFYILSFSI